MSTLISLQNIFFSYPLYGEKPRSTSSHDKIGGSIEIKKGIPYINAISNVSLELAEGDRLGIIGHNGSGKSTLLRLLCGIFEPTRGSVTINGTALAVLDKSMGMDPDLTGRENIFTRALLLGKSKAAVEEKLTDIQNFTELGEFLDLPIRVYSPGMKTRLAFAVTTAFKPDILVLDEWMSAGDKAFKKKAKQRMDEFFLSARAVVLASHSEKLISSMCNKVIELDKGQLVNPIDNLPLTTSYDYDLEE